MARYITQEMNDLDGKGEKRVYYRMKIEENIDANQFMDEIAYPGSGLSRASVVSVMTAVAEQLARCMADGRSVTLEGIGTFKPKLGVVKDKEIDTLAEGEPQRNAQSLKVNGVSFRADKKLVRDTNRRCKLTRGGTSRIKSSPYAEEERLAQALRFLDEHHVMHVSDYMRITRAETDKRDIGTTTFPPCPIQRDHLLRQRETQSVYTQKRGLNALFSLFYSGMTIL